MCSSESFKAQGMLNLKNLANTLKPENVINPTKHIDAHLKDVQDNIDFTGGVTEQNKQIALANEQQKKSIERANRATAQRYNTVL